MVFSDRWTVPEPESAPAPTGVLGEVLFDSAAVAELADLLAERFDVISS